MKKKCVKCGNDELKEYQDRNNHKIYFCEKCRYWRAEFKRAKYKKLGKLLMYSMIVIVIYIFMLSLI